MLSARDVPKRFFPEAVVWATYVLNRIPTLFIKDMNPKKAWSGVKPLVKHFRVFGCEAYVHVSYTQRRKLDNNNSRFVLLGLCEESKAYKLYDTKSKKTMIRRDDNFKETKG